MRTQLFDERVRLRQGAPCGDALGGGLTDVADLGHLLDRRGQQRIERAEVIAEDAAGLLADVADAEREQQPRQIARFARFDRADEVVRPGIHLFAERQQLLDRQVVQIGGGLHQSGVDELLQVALAAAVDVHRVAGREVHEVAQQLRRAGSARAADGGFVLIIIDRCAADRAELRELIRHGIQRTPILLDADDLGDDLARLAHGNNVAHARVELSDKIAVMQRRAGDRRTGKPHRLEHGVRREHAGAADRDDDVLQERLLDLGRILVRRRPSREFRGRAERFTLREGIDLDDCAVDVEIQLAARLAHVLDLVLYVLRVGVDRIARTCRKAEAFQIVERLHMALHRQLVAVLDVEAEDRELSFPRDPAVLLAQRACGRVARIGEQRLFVQLKLGVQRVKHRLFHIDLTAHDEMRRRVFQLFRNVLDRPEVFRDVLTDLTVAARRAAHELAVDVLERDRKAVDLVFDNVLRASDRVFHARVELAELVEREHILQALERIGVRHLGEASACRAADALRRGICIRQLGVLLLERTQLSLHHVVLVIRNFGRVVVIVFFVMIPQLLAQRGDLFTCVHS